MSDYSKFQLKMTQLKKELYVSVSATLQRVIYSCAQWAAE